MKANHIIFIIVALLFTFSACREITVTTKVNEDGSFTRTITVTGDSANIFTKNLPYPIDESWLTEVKRDSADSSLYVTYTKSYPNSDVLNFEIKNDTGHMSLLNRSVEINKRFGFFYSYLTFDEIIRAINPFTFLDVNDHLSQEDIRWITYEILPRTSADTAAMNKAEEKALEFLAKSITAELVSILEKGIRELNDPLVDPKIPHIYHDSLFKLVNEWAFDTPTYFIDTLSYWTGKTALLKLKNTDPDIFSEFNAKSHLFHEVLDMSEYKQIVEMPGLITETNSVVLKGNQVSWHVQNLSYLFVDYKMHIETRIVNYWMFVLTGLIVLVLLVFLVIKAFK